MKKEGKDHPVWFALKIAALLLFVVIPITVWHAGWDLWTKLHEKEGR